MNTGLPTKGIAGSDGNCGALTTPPSKRGGAKKTILDAEIRWHENLLDAIPKLCDAAAPGTARQVLP